MSHFTVLVVGDDPELQLAPYHEFECTGEDDQYIQEIDETEKLWNEYLKATETRLRGPDGTLHSFFDNSGNWRLEFSQPESSFPGRRTYFVPEGYEKIEVPTPQVESFAEFIEGWSGQKVVPYGSEPDLEGEHKYGYVLVDDDGVVTKVIDRTNPNAKWDWYQLGGRWTGFFKLKAGADGRTGKQGLMTAPAEAGWVDQAQKRDIDFEFMRNEAEQKAREDYQAFHNLVGDVVKPESWTSVLTREPDIARAREIYRAQPIIQILDKSDEYRWEDNPERYFVTEDEFAQAARDSAIGTFAVVKDGQWYEKGSMGWWGCVSDPKDKDVWNREFSKLLDDVSDDTLLSVYDCHI